MSIELFHKSFLFLFFLLLLGLLDLFLSFLLSLHHFINSIVDRLMTNLSDDLLRVFVDDRFRLDFLMSVLKIDYFRLSLSSRFF